MKQLVKIGKLKQFLHQPYGQGSQAESGAQRDASTRPTIGTIGVILTSLRRIGSQPSKVMSIARTPTEDLPHDSKRGRVEI